MAANEPLGKLEWNFSQVFGERTPGEEVQDGASESRGAARAARVGVFSPSPSRSRPRAPPPPSRVSVARARGDRAARAARRPLRAPDP